MLNLTAGNDGAVIHPQVCPRPVDLPRPRMYLPSLRQTRAAYREITDLPLAERVQRMRDPEVRRRIPSKSASTART